MFVAERVNALAAPASDVQSLLERIHARVDLQRAVTLATRNRRNRRGAGRAHVRPRTRGTISYAGIVLEAFLLALLSASKPQEQSHAGDAYHGGNNTHDDADDRARLETTVAVLHIDSRCFTRCRFIRARRGDEDRLDGSVGRDRLDL